MSQPFPKYAGKGIGGSVADIQCGLGYARPLRERQHLSGSFHADQLDIAMHRDAEGCPELAMEMVLRQGRNGTQRIEAKIVLKMLVDVAQHPFHARVMGRLPRRHPALLWRDHSANVLEGTLD